MKEHVFFKCATLASVIFTLMVTVVSIMAWLVGENTQELSTLFRLGSDGIANATILEMLSLSIIISCLQTLFFYGKVFEKIRTLWKTIFVILSALVATIGFIVIFGWFSTTFMKAWVLFALSFGGCSVVSIAIMVIKAKMESNKYDRLLEQYKSKKSASDQ